MTALQKIIGTAFLGETVELDGKSFEGCNFEDCTLVYRDHTKAGLAIMGDCTLVPGCRIETPSCPGLADFIWLHIFKNDSRMSSRRHGIEFRGKEATE
jgi:hypothetical protein